MPQLRQFRHLVPVLFVGLAAVSLAACDVVINSMDGGFGGGRFKAEKSYAKTFTVNAQGAKFEVVNTNGKIDVEAVDGTTIDVKATIIARGNTDEAARESLKQIEMQEEASPTLVRLEARHPKIRQAIEVQYTLRVPRSVKVSLQTTNGGISVVGIQAGFKAETTNGSVKGQGLSGPVDASTTNGGVDIQMNALAADGVRLDTTNGGITLSLPADAKASLAARCVNGGITVSDLPFEKDGVSNRRRVEGKINGGGAPLKLETVNGGVRVKRVQSADAPGKASEQRDHESGRDAARAGLKSTVKSALRGHAG